MSGLADAPTVTETLALYEAYRAYVRHEDGLINFRTTWFITVQGILFAISGLTIQRNVETVAGLIKDRGFHADEAAKITGLLDTIKLDGGSPFGRALAALDYILVGTPVVGMVMCLISFVSVLAAHRAIYHVGVASGLHHARFKLVHLPGLTGGGGTFPIFGLALSLVMPTAVALFWACSFLLVQPIFSATVSLIIPVLIAGAWLVAFIQIRAQ